jgi:hypothetical protein
MLMISPTGFRLSRNSVRTVTTRSCNEGLRLISERLEGIMERICRVTLSNKEIKVWMLGILRISALFLH